MGEPNLPSTKDRARRIDPRYVRHMQPWRRTRRWLSIVFCCVLLVWLGLSSVERTPEGKFVFTAMVHNPGHLTAAHAMIEHDCLACHDGDGRGGFIKTVSDTACLKCHDAGIHNENQTELFATQAVAATTQASDADLAATKISLLPDNHPSQMRSSDCVHCHTEHQGESALRGTDPAICLECHTDLKSHDKLNPPGVQDKIVAFDGNGGHPHFGEHPDPLSNLGFKDGKLSDLTHIKFNHAFHNTQEGLRDNCVACHTPMSPSPVAMSEVAAGNEPLRVGGDRPLSAQSQARLGDMQPITFERNCVQCHQLKLSDGLAVTHANMVTVRSELASLPALAISQLNPADASVKGAAALQTTVSSLLSDAADQLASDASFSDRADKADGQVDTASTTNQKVYFKQQAAALRYMDALSQANLDGIAPLPPATVQALGALTFAKVPECNAAEVYMAYLAPFGTSCNTCHEMNGGDIPAAYQYKQALVDAAATRPALAQLAVGLPGPTTDPAASPTTRPIDLPPVLLATIRTGIPNSPQHWFAQSHFDHAAHRDLSCFSCHANAWTSSDTSDLLLPNLDNNNVPKGSTDLNGHVIKSCVDCHAPPASSAQLSAPSNCITCHVYHDRTKEDSLDAMAREKHHPTTVPST